MSAVTFPQSSVPHDTGPSGAGAPTGPVSPLRRFGRRKWDPQPTQPAAVLIATAGHDVPESAIRQAAAASEGGAVAVVALARVYGSAFGLPNPGLMPTRKELQAERDRVTAAVAAIERCGVTTWGQVAATRRPVRTISRIAAARGARVVLVVTPETSRWRRTIEGDLARDVGRRLGKGVQVEPVPVKSSMPPDKAPHRRGEAVGDRTKETTWPST